MSHTTDLPVSRCFHCGKPLDMATSQSRKSPEPGDISICVYCGHIAIFDDDRYLRPLSDEEIIEIAGHPKILAAQKLLDEFKRKHKLP